MLSSDESDDDEESDYSDESDYDEDEDFDDEFDDSCPPGCDQTLYDKVLELREKLKARIEERLKLHPESIEALDQRTGVRELPSPHDIAPIITFLCSDIAGIINGSILDITAGTHLLEHWSQP